MVKSPIQKVTNKLQYRAIGIVNGVYKPQNLDQINRGTLKDNEGNVLRLSSFNVDELIQISGYLNKRIIMLKMKQFVDRFQKNKVPINEYDVSR